MRDLKGFLIALAILGIMLFLAFWLGRKLGQADAENELIAKRDTVIRVDTIRYPDPQPHLVTQEVIRYKYVPATSKPDTVYKEKHDTIISVQDGVAVIPISLKTYTDSSTYKAVVSGYDPRLESIEVYQQVVEITTVHKPPKWSIGLQGGVYATPAGVQPGIGVGVTYNLFWK